MEVMKKQILFAAAALALAAIACQKNPSEAPVTEPVMRTFTCTFASAQSDQPINITVQSVLDGRILGQSVTRFQRSTARAMGV